MRGSLLGCCGKLNPVDTFFYHHCAKMYVNIKLMIFIVKKNLFLFLFLFLVIFQ